MPTVPSLCGLIQLSDEKVDSDGFSNETIFWNALKGENPDIY